MNWSVDAEREVSDRIHLESLPGVIERLLQQCHDLGAPLLTEIRRVDDSVAAHLDGALDPVAQLRMYSALSVVLGGFEESREKGYEDAVAVLGESRRTGVLSALMPTDAAPGFRIDPLADRWRLRDLVEERLGWVNAPQSWQVNLTRRGDLLLAQVGPLYHSARFAAMERIPASTNPLIAALMVQFAKPDVGNVVYDPFCGAGTLLVEAAALDRRLRLVGSDVSAKALAAADVNRSALFPGAVLLRADATAMPLGAESVDRVVSNIPFGKRIGSHGSNIGLYPAFLGELGRVLRLDGRAVVLTDDKNLFRASVEGTRGLRLLREVKLSSGGLHPSAFILERTRAARRAAGRGPRRG
ncbi:MAG TPA: methyltransferase domain-containing protein [Actinocrinis sp.]|nr:methyltransferase domain-containing protein [Actinocrinis sp.]